MTAAPSWRPLVALTDGTRASLPAVMTVQPAPRPVPDSMVTAWWLIAVAAIIAVGAAAAVRRPSAAAALAYRAGHAAGVAWATLRSFGAWLLDSLKRLLE
jgi:hypothetical protein